MKTRTGFVSNSSSTSFIVASDKPDKVMVNFTFELNMADIANTSIVTDISELDEAADCFNMLDEEYEQCKRLLGEGKTLYLGDLEEENLKEIMTEKTGCNDLLGLLKKHFKENMEIVSFGRRD
jgi:hypothetical protein